MDYKRTIEFLYSLQKFGIKFGLSSTEALLDGLGRPHEGLPCLHLAGTNGKGSVGATIVSILNKAGHKTGFFTSPHLVSFRERFAVGSEMISQGEVVRLTERVRAVMASEEPPTFFEFVTAMAFLYFAEQKVDLAVLETGMGGRLDATNVARPLVGVITNISRDHTDY
ncbi:MAG: Mur ligase family protein, partial [Thermodesulfobacteriota bacterium]|nr:Mur ligase family protein [Thermodesulfobacteriota bacterium]